MKYFRIQAPDKISAEIHLNGSKSIMNRALILSKIIPQLEIIGSSDADDVKIMLQALNNPGKEINIENAGTCFRFLTALYASSENTKIILNGNEAMHKRPIKELVDVLLEIGANIEYLGEIGFPPLKISGKKLKGKSVSIPAQISSQFISALCMAAMQMETKLTLKLVGDKVSESYLLMTVKMMEEIGCNITFQNNIIEINPEFTSIKNNKIFVEADWSSASYWLAILALHGHAEIKINQINYPSIQADSKAIEHFKALGVAHRMSDNGLIFTKTNLKQMAVEYNLIDSPDLAPTLAVALCGLGFTARINGISHLQIKESNRLKYVPEQLAEQGFGITKDGNSWVFTGIFPSTQKALRFKTYNDHRLAMSFACLAAKGYTVEIENPDCVQKSYPKFWDDLILCGFKIIECS